MGYQLLTTDKRWTGADGVSDAEAGERGAGVRLGGLREGACDGISRAMVSGRIAAWAAGVCASAAAQTTVPRPGEFTDVLERGRRVRCGIGG